jgi:hypothetical protein
MSASVKKTAEKRKRHVLTGPGPGRPKGVPNKLSGTAKENIEKVFEGMGGVDGMIKWAGSSERNKTIFFSDIYPRILPMDVAHSGSVAVLHFDFGENGNGHE